MAAHYSYDDRLYIDPYGSTKNRLDVVSDHTGMRLVAISNHYGRTIGYVDSDYGQVLLERIKDLNEDVRFGEPRPGGVQERPVKQPPEPTPEPQPEEAPQRGPWREYLPFLVLGFAALLNGAAGGEQIVHGRWGLVGIHATLTLILLMLLEREIAPCATSIIVTRGASGEV